MSIHERIKRRREALGLGVSEFAKQVTALAPKEFPATRQMVQFWERKTVPKKHHLPAVAQVLKTTADDLLGRGDPARVSSDAVVFAETLTHYLMLLPAPRRPEALRACIELLERLRQQPARAPSPHSKPTPAHAAGQAQRPSRRRADAS